MEICHSRAPNIEPATCIESCFPSLVRRINSVPKPFHHFRLKDRPNRSFCLWVGSGDSERRRVLLYLPLSADTCRSFGTSPTTHEQPISHPLECCSLSMCLGCGCCWCCCGRTRIKEEMTNGHRSKRLGAYQCYQDDEIFMSIPLMRYCTPPLPASDQGTHFE